MSQEIIHGDCLNEMRMFSDNHFSGIVTDPPYGLQFMGKQWDQQVPGKEYWKEMLRISKPGSHLLAFGGTRTYHRLACAIEDAGWEVRDCIMYVYGSGFPKSHNFGCKCTGDPVPYNHEKTTKSSTESSLRSMSETDLSETIANSASENETLFESMQKQDLQSFRCMPIQGNETSKEPCMEGRNNLQEEQRELHRPKVFEMSSGISRNGPQGRICDGASISDGQAFEQSSSENRSSSSQRSQHTKQSNRKSRTISRQQNAQNSGMATCEKCGGLKDWKGFGTALKPAYEPILLCMKPLDGTFAQNAEKWGQAGINIDECRIPGYVPLTHEGITQNKIYGAYKRNSREFIPDSNGRWPANIILDEEAGEMLDEMSGISFSKHNKRGKVEIFKKEKSWIGSSTFRGHTDSGGASRFFYCAKASSSERGEDNKHPTVKPLKLMEYLLKLIAPPKGALILDPFCGSGTTLLAAKNLGISAVGIEKEEAYCEIIRGRLNVKQLDFMEKIA